MLRQLFFQFFIGMLHDFRYLCISKQKVACRDNHSVLHNFYRPLCGNIKEADTVYDIVKKFDTQRMVVIHRIHVNNATTRCIA